MKAAWPWSGLGTALIGAASLHILAAAAISQGFEAPQAAGHATGAVDPTHLKLEIRLVAAPAELPEPTIADATAAPTDSVVSAPVAGAEPPSTAPAAALPLVDLEAGEGSRYFEVAEVDTPATPRPDWQVDVALLLGLGVHSFSVDVLISDTGVAEHCAVTRIEPDQSPGLRQAVAAKLCETVLSPAMRRGAAVRSLRHIELLLASP